MRRSNQHPSFVCLAAAFAVAGASTARADNLLSNADFEQLSPSGAVTSFTGHGGGGYSAADNWTVFNNTPGSNTTTQLLPSSRTPGSQMLRVITSGGANGIVQVFLPFDTGPGCTISAAWVRCCSALAISTLREDGSTRPPLATRRPGSSLGGLRASSLRLRRS